MTLVPRAAYALFATALVIWCLRSGLPFGAVAVVILGTLLRRRVDALAHPLARRR